MHGYLDGTLIMERTLPRIDTVLAIAGRDERTGDIVLKAVNSAPEPATMSVQINGVGQVGTAAQLDVLTSENPLDENSFEQPTKIVPRSSTIAIAGPRFSHTFPANSLSIIRLRPNR